MLSKNFNGNVISSHSDHHGRLILLNIEINEHVYTLVNVYAPNDIHERIVFLGKSCLSLMPMQSTRLS